MSQCVCSESINCKQSSVGNGNYFHSSETVHLKHIYVANTTMIKLNKGELTINSNNIEELKCIGESLILIEKNQTLSIKCRSLENHFEFKLIDIQSDLMCKMYSLLVTGNKSAYTLNKRQRIGARMLSSPLHPGMNEAFDNVFSCLQKLELRECGDCARCEGLADGAALDFTLFFLLSAFTNQESGVGILSRTITSSLRERVYNMIKNSPSKAWCLDEVAANLHMSRSSLKRKLNKEKTSFTEIYLDVRMRMAAKLLRTGDYSINHVAEMCGYKHSTHFITTFKKYFQITPYSFMNLINH